MRSTDDEMVDVLDNHYVTAARTPDGALAVVYVPTQRTIRLALSLIPPGARFAWIDPADAAAPSRPAQIDRDGRVSTPGANAGGDEDWLLVVTP
ncbi:putative collagen-binding domain-containing protein [Rhodococcus aetherivorans]|uniref:putative collagen-binding domain-containing protein n=1 Tax=Rhodococcus aetherivorans TaxID=191292 RepID=UPI003673B816